MRNQLIVKHNQQDKPTITAMISVYKSSKWLEHRFINLFETTAYKEKRLIIHAVNADSPDPLDDEICREFAKTHPESVKYDKIDFCTVYAAWNYIIRKSKTKYVTNANSDDLIAPQAYDMMANACESGYELAYCGWHTISDSVLRWSEVTGPGNPAPQYDPSRSLVSCGHFPLWNRELHDKVGLFDPKMRALGDADFWYRCYKAGLAKFAAISEPIAAYRWRGEGSDGNLWNRTPEDVRADEWRVMASRTGEKLIFD